MSDANTVAGPERTAAVYEVQGLFGSEPMMQDAIGRLTLAGFDRAELSLPVAHVDAAHATPETSAEVPVTPIDGQQMRTMATSMAGTIGAFAAAGVTIATGGLAGVAIAAAAAVGGGAAAITHLASDGAVEAAHQPQVEAAARGELVLAVRVSTQGKRDAALQIMRDAGATQVGDVARRTAAIEPAPAEGVDSASWTG